ncbi:MAG: hypothetical protein A3D74_04815 [Candidatus Levybacteria bacterium RIFCSPHIGHO2_02_FULL_37_13]|nr:MAG: hypothetical protein A3D74_04815 [Candidatus Levybacteria bacterium RIFCSPHIGHO2_02_FULL_37_13]
MRKTQQKPKDEQTIDILKRVAKRVEEAAIDISDMKSDLKMVSIRLSNVEHNTKMMKVDMEKMRTVLDEVKRSSDDLMEITAEILKKAVTHDEHNALSQRVSALEQS